MTSQRAVEQQVVLPPGGHLGCVIEAGQALRIVDLEGQQVADLISFDRNDPREQLSMYHTRAVARRWQISTPHRLYSNLANELWLIEEDSVGEHYWGGGYCNARINEVRYGRPDAPNCEQNLEAAIGPFGLDRWSFNPDTLFNVFMNVAYEPDGSWEIREPRTKAGDYIVLRALKSQIVGISNCPQLLNRCNAGRLKPLRIDIVG
ncbi:MAG: urea carboxylase-associated family protein [Chloroflexi bacterium]|nr:urea carboxylase-associated family protein [Chloroflexota bacterium]